MYQQMPVKCPTIQVSCYPKVVSFFQIFETLKHEFFTPLTCGVCPFPFTLIIFYEKYKLWSPWRNFLHSMLLPVSYIQTFSSALCSTKMASVFVYWLWCDTKLNTSCTVTCHKLCLISWRTGFPCVLIPNRLLVSDPQVNRMVYNYCWFSPTLVPADFP